MEGTSAQDCVGEFDARRIITLDPWRAKGWGSSLARVSHSTIVVRKLLGAASHRTEIGTGRMEGA